MAIFHTIDTVPERNLHRISMERRDLYQLYGKFNSIKNTVSQSSNYSLYISMICTVPLALNPDIPTNIFESDQVQETPQK